MMGEASVGSCPRRVIRVRPGSDGTGSSSDFAGAGAAGAGKAPAGTAGFAAAAGAAGFGASGDAVTGRGTEGATDCGLPARGACFGTTSGTGGVGPEIGT